MGESAMRAIYFDPNKLNLPEEIRWWSDYNAKSQTATNEVIVAWEQWLIRWQMDPGVEEFSHDFKQTIWKDLKCWLYEHVVNRKCAYCESPLELDRYLGDAEHFRPKGQVTNKESGKRERVSVKFENGRDLNHPGYFWLAYDWRNLMPVCSACNSGAAKVDQFPTDAACLVMVRLSVDEVGKLLAEPRASALFPGLYYLSPVDLDGRERPLLLNPLNPPKGGDPRDHLRFGLAGVVVELDLSLRGKNSIEVLKLDRGVLTRRRQRAQEEVHRKFYAALQKPGADYARLLREDLASYFSGAEEYSAAALDYLEIIQALQLRAYEAATRSDS
jgi:hypothetical protein